MLSFCYTIHHFNGDTTDHFDQADAQLGCPMISFKISDNIQPTHAMHRIEHSSPLGIIKNFLEEAWMIHG